MAWDSVTSATQLTTVSTEQFFTTVPVTTPGETFHVDIDANSSGTTDNLIVAVYGSLQGTPDYDDTPLLEFEIDTATTDPNKVSFTVSGVYQFRVGVRRNGSTDTFTVDMDSRGNGIDL